MSLVLPPLPYSIGALEPHISRRTLTAHHDHHHAGYLDKTRALVRNTPLEYASLDEIVRSSAPATPLFNAAAQAWNHAFYWQCMRPGGGAEPHGPIAKLIEDEFGSSTAFRREFVKAAGDQFGSGWGWLVLDGDRVRIFNTPNAETPLTTPQIPLLAIDVWEHAYYLDFQHRRLDYIAAFLTHLVNWDFANDNLSSATRSAVARGADPAVRSMLGLRHSAT